MNVEPDLRAFDIICRLLTCRYVKNKLFFTNIYEVWWLQTSAEASNLLKHIRISDKDERCVLIWFQLLKSDS